MRVLSVIVVFLGLASLVVGILFTINSGSAENEVSESIAPLPLDQLDARYDAVKTNQLAMAAQEGAAIQNGQAPSEMYSWLTLQRTSLGLARSNVGLAQLTRTLGILNIIIGAGLVLTGIVALRRAAN